MLIRIKEITNDLSENNWFKNIVESLNNFDCEIYIKGLTQSEQKIKVLSLANEKGMKAPTHVICYSQKYKKFLKPSNKEELLHVKGFGEKKIEQIGASVIRIINLFKVIDNKH